MTREEIEQTEWAKEFKWDAPISYEQGIDYALKPNLEVYLNNNSDLGYWVWAIIVDDDKGFWMDAKETKDEAKELCNKMGWKITFIGEERNG